jgi:hypothetical protein
VERIFLFNLRELKSQMSSKSANKSKFGMSSVDGTIKEDAPQVPVPPPFESIYTLM